MEEFGADSFLGKMFPAVSVVRRMEMGIYFGNVPFSPLARKGVARI